MGFSRTMNIRLGLARFFVVIIYVVDVRSVLLARTCSHSQPCVHERGICPLRERWERWEWV